MSATRYVLLTVGLGFASASQAGLITDFTASGGTVAPVLNAGAPPDSPAGRVDPNVLGSLFTGVVSLNIRYIDQITGQQLSFICSGTAISAYTVLTAAHCVDTAGNGTVIDITQPGNDVRVVLNDADPFNAATDLITASAVTMNPDYDGFNVCSDGTAGCVNDDLAVVRLSTALPPTVQIYEIYDQPILPDTVLTMVGYGTSGDGINGYTVGPNFFVKREGANVFDLFDTDDEQGFSATSAPEVWYYDFDGTKDGLNRDTFCLLGLACSAQLANDVETHLGGGDSGGPSFVMTSSGYQLAAVNTFGINFRYGTDDTNGDFGDAGGGILLNSYRSWIRIAIPEPGSLALLGLGLLGVAATRRRQR
jgi:hypothetical protein